MEQGLRGTQVRWGWKRCDLGRILRCAQDDSLLLWMRLLLRLGPRLRMALRMGLRVRRGLRLRLRLMENEVEREAGAVLAVGLQRGGGPGFGRGCRAGQACRS